MSYELFLVPFTLTLMSHYPGLAAKNTFKLYFNEYNAATSEFIFDVVLLASAVIHNETVPQNKSKYVLRALEHVLQRESLSGIYS